MWRSASLRPALGVSPAPGRWCAASGGSGVAPFSFIDRSNVATNVYVTTETKTVSGFTGPLTASVSNGQMRINSGSFGSSSQPINAGDSLTLRHLSAASVSTTVSTTVTVGDYNSGFKSTTTSQDRTPDAFNFGTQTNVAAGCVVTSAVTTLKGFDSSTVIAPGPGIEYSIHTGSFATASGSLLPGQTLKVRHTASANKLAYTKTYLKIGGVIGYFTTRTTNASGAPATPGPYYLAYAFRPHSQAASGAGVNGLFVLPSNNLGSMPVAVTQQPVSIRATLRQRNSDRAGNVSGHQRRRHCP